VPPVPEEPELPVDELEPEEAEPLAEESLAGAGVLEPVSAAAELPDAAPALASEEAAVAAGVLAAPCAPGTLASVELAAELAAELAGALAAVLDDDPPPHAEIENTKMQIAAVRSAFKWFNGAPR